MSRLSRLLTIGVLAAATIGAGCWPCDSDDPPGPVPFHTVPDSQWWTYQANPQRTGNIANGEISAPLRLKWQVDIADASNTYLSPAVFGDARIFYGVARLPVTAGPGEIQARSIDDGALLWSYEAPTLRTSNVAWHEFRSAPAAASGHVYAMAEHGYLAALDQEDGSLEWSNYLPGVESSRRTIAISARTIVVFTENHNIITIHQEDGEILGTESVGIGAPQQYSAPSIHEGGKIVLLIPSRQGGVAEAVDGAVFVNSHVGLHSRPLGGVTLPWTPPPWDHSVWKWYFAPIVTDDLVITSVYLQSTEPFNGWRAVDRSDGSEVWSVRAKRPPLNQAALTDGKLIVLDDGKMKALDVATGALIWTADVPGSAWGAPAVSNGLAFCVGVLPVVGDDHLSAVDIANGNLVWTTTLERGMGGPGNGSSTVGHLAIDQGVLIVPHHGRLYAFESDTSP